MSPLHLYRASAGSGKTFALTLEYLKLMFRNPGSHRNILAVTFTNRAAGEMKERILKRLHALSSGKGDQHPKEMAALTSVSGLDEAGVRERAGELLNRILNDYSWFSVGTIDKFFQSVIRAFTHEIGIQPGYNLELDHRRILSLAVDRLFHELGEDEEVQQWLIRYAEERLEESKAWNFRDDMVDLGLQLFRESFQGLFLEQEMSMLDKQHLRHYGHLLDEEQGRAMEESKRIGGRALETIRQAGAEIEDFKLRGNSPPSLFREAFTGNELRFTESKLAALEDTDKWLKKDADEAMISLTEQVLMPLYRLLYDQYAVLNTITAIRKNLYTMGILGDLRERVIQYTNEKNLFLIADSSRFLKGIIGGNQVPFIYERTGNRYHQIMLDEFQDTSVFQYDNFRPLLDEALAGGHFNLVVGDVKQSIYRWRNSDWNLLAEKLEKDFGHQVLEVQKLNENYRSREMIIRFNNTVFQLAPHILARQIEHELLEAAADREEVLSQVTRFKKAYEDAVQQFGKKGESKGGAVRMEFFGEQEEGFRESVLRRIPEWIMELRDAGIEPGEVAILVRNKREGTMVANALLEHGRKTGDSENYRLVSSESLLLGYNRAVTLILSALRHMVHPGDQLNNALLKYFYSLVQEEGGPPGHQLFDNQVTPEEWLGESWTEHVGQMKSLPLYELIESLIGLFRLDRKAEDLPYLQAFQDLVIEIQRREPMGIAGFLQYWEQFGIQKGIASAEESDALRIMTIHKSKGLEFRAVIIPFCSWEITTDQRKSNILWCETGGTPFHALPVVPVRYSSSMQHTLFSSFYYQERMKGYMDNLNLLYVAFTRAREVLYLGVPEREEERLNHVGDLLQHLMPLEPEKGPSLEGALKMFRSDQMVSVGKLPENPGTRREPDTWKFNEYPVTRRKLPLRVRMRSDEYFVEGEVGPGSVRMFGNVMHQIFSGIDEASDVDRVVDAFHREGLLPGDSREEIREYVHDRISQEGVRSWFSASGGQIFKEHSILCGEGVVIRPDRVMVEGDRATVVDFKFGEMERDQDRRQVANYMHHLKKMGYRAVQGYLWYVTLGKTVQIPES